MICPAEASAWKLPVFRYAAGFVGNGDNAMFYLMAAALALLPGGHARAPGDGGKAKPVKEKKICRSTEVTGSLFAARECHTAAEWKQIDGKSRADTENVQRGDQFRAPTLK